MAFGGKTRQEWIREGLTLFRGGGGYLEPFQTQPFCDSAILCPLLRGLRDPAPPPAHPRAQLLKGPGPLAATHDAPGAPRFCPVPCSLPFATGPGWRPPAPSHSPRLQGSRACPFPPAPGLAAHRHITMATHPTAPGERQPRFPIAEGCARRGCPRPCSARRGPSLSARRGCRPLTRQLQRPGQHRSHAGEEQCACAPPTPSQRLSAACWEL